MIEEIQNGIRKITLGDKTTFISQIIKKGETESLGICFSNVNPDAGFKAFNGSEVIIEFTNFNGVLSYLKAGYETLKTWSISDSNIEIIDSLIKSIDEELNK